MNDVLDVVFGVCIEDRWVAGWLSMNVAVGL